MYKTIVMMVSELLSTGMNATVLSGGLLNDAGIFTRACKYIFQ